MDIYNLYNFINNIMTTHSKIKESLIMKDPLINLNLEYNILKGGAPPAAAVAAATKTPPPAAAKTPPTAAAKTPPTATPTATPTAAKTPGETPEAAKGNDSKGAENNDDDNDIKPKTTEERIKELIGKFSKFIIILMFILLIPIAPFVALSYYSFKRLKSVYNKDIYTL